MRGMAEFMQSIGAYNALNMDGGGSTTMVARPLGESSVKVMNKPSDGVVRSVINAVGVISTAPPAELAGIIIETDDMITFPTKKKKIFVKGYVKKHSTPSKWTWMKSNGVFPELREPSKAMFSDRAHMAKGQ